MKHLRSVPDAVRYARHHSGMNRAFPSCIILITPFSLTSSFSTTANIYAHIDVDSKMEAANMIASEINLGELPEKKKSPKRKIA